MKLNKFGLCVVPIEQQTNIGCVGFIVLLHLVKLFYTNTCFVLSKDKCIVGFHFFDNSGSHIVRIFYVTTAAYNRLRISSSRLVRMRVNHIQLFCADICIVEGVSFILAPSVSSKFWRSGRFLRVV